MTRTWNMIVVFGCLLFFPTVAGALSKVGPPPAGKIYHGVYPGGVTGEEDDITPADVDAYEAAVGKQVAWVYFSHNWYAGVTFPLATATWIRDRGAVPFIRLMLRANSYSERPRHPFKLKNILRGELDADLRQWARDARDFGTPLLVEFGTECNGEWFPWNARWNGGGTTDRFGDPNVPDGAERFVYTYRRIVTLAREEGADNITWVFHINWDDWPDTDWNRIDKYYPGDEFVDWVAISAYGPQTPMDDYLDLFRDEVDWAYARLQAVAPSKPVIIAEFGATAGNPLIAPEDWAGPALDDILAFRWPAVIGFSWWNERWENDNDPAHDTDMRVQDIPALAQTFTTKLDAAAGELQLTPVSIPAPTQTPTPEPYATCPPTPLATCDTPERSRLLMKKDTDPTRDLLKFDFIRGTTPRIRDDFRDPTENANYLVCLYNGSALTAGLAIPVDSTKWRATGGGTLFRYSDRQTTADGVRLIKLQAGETGIPRPPKVRVRGKGSLLPDLPVPAPTPIDVTVQVINARNHNCWGDRYTAAQTNQSGPPALFRARNPG